MSGTLRNKVQRKCKMRGYTLKVEALTEILSFLSSYEDAEDEALELLLDELQHQSLKSSILDKEPIQRVVSLLCEAASATDDTLGTNTSSSFSVIDAFLIPKFRYDPIKKIFCEHTGRLPIHGDAPSKAWLYRDRFLLLSQRLSRIPQFSSSSFDSELSEFGSCEISKIQSLVGRTGVCWVMGVISQLEDGHFYLEDLTGAVEINLSNAKITTGYFSENTIVLAQGEMLLDGTFQVQTFGFPPLEDREKSTSLFTGLDYFGGGTLAKEDTIRLAEMESRAVNEMFVILSDIWLDHEETMAKLEIVLDGYEEVEVVPSLFVLMGNFCSHPFNLSYSSFSSIRSSFGKLGEMIAKHPRLKEQSRFLFIPGPEDAGPSSVLPKCALPKYITVELQKHVPNAIFASNPCRIKFYTQEIVFFRQDLLYRMRRNCLIPSSTEETSEHFEHLVATITHQSHLCPLPLSVQPIIWNYDHCLHLYPTPHTIVLGDSSEQKAFKYTGITCFNPGSFANDSTFVVYRPCNQEVELSALDT
ncbi:DNA polymerase epsilon subunit B [Lactuca sativa]|uniref:DNA polymerase epsilon subunit B n=1 Tax=Lactuca sativa TaxID=4236 RepID=UPI000CD9C310|nr:DNA polymerase epsilon subunit B [Lactuca sativa]